MSVLTAPAPAPAAPSGGGWWRRRRSMLVVLGGLVLALVVVLLTGTGESRREGRLDPDNPGPDGAQAVARVLEDQGVDVTIVRSDQAFQETRVDTDTTVVVTSTGDLGRSTTARLQLHALGAHVVLIEPGRPVLDAFGIDGYPEPVDATDGLAADCTPFDGLDVQVDDAAGYDGDGCFGSEAHLFVAHDRLWLFGAGDALTNDQVLRADNAAVALRLLGQDQRLVWYVPDVADLSSEDALSVGSLLPDWLEPALLMTVLAAVALMLWRGRRLGKLATEPLPVTVKAIETTRSRGRLYRRSGDRAHAAVTLRSAARRRCARYLSLGTAPAEDAVVGAVATHLGRPHADIAALLADTAPVPGSDRGLIQLASALAALEEEVRR